MQKDSGHIVVQFWWDDSFSIEFFITGHCLNAVALLLGEVRAFNPQKAPHVLCCETHPSLELTAVKSAESSSCTDNAWRYSLPKGLPVVVWYYWSISCVLTAKLWHASGAAGTIWHYSSQADRPDDSQFRWKSDDWEIHGSRSGTWRAQYDTTSCDKFTCTQKLATVIYCMEPKRKK